MILALATLLAAAATTEQMRHRVARPEVTPPLVWTPDNIMGWLTPPEAEVLAARCMSIDVWEPWSPPAIRVNPADRFGAIGGPEGILRLPIEWTVPGESLTLPWDWVPMAVKPPRVQPPSVERKRDKERMTDRGAVPRPGDAERQKAYDRRSARQAEKRGERMVDRGVKPRSPHDLAEDDRSMWTRPDPASPGKAIPIPADETPDGHLPRGTIYYPPGYFEPGSEEQTRYPQGAINSTKEGFFPAPMTWRQKFDPFGDGEDPVYLDRPEPLFRIFPDVFSNRRPRAEAREARKAVWAATLARYADRRNQGVEALMGRFPLVVPRRANLNHYLDEYAYVLYLRDEPTPSDWLGATPLPEFPSFGASLDVARIAVEWPRYYLVPIQPGVSMWQRQV